jgi:hypothetical protein
MNNIPGDEESKANAPPIIWDLARIIIIYVIVQNRNNSLVGLWDLFILLVAPIWVLPYSTMIIK